MRDYHIHSNFSDDCTKQPMLVACETAIANGISEIAFTEHVDIDYPITRGDFQLDYLSYSKEVEDVRNQFPQLTILKGLELGMQSDIVDKMNTYVDEHNFDFILGSIHTGDALELHGGDFSQGKTPEQAIQRYFEIVLSCISVFSSFHVLAHVDLIRRYISHDYKFLNYQPYYDIIDEIFKCLVIKGIGLEINTSGWRYDVGDFLPGYELLKRYREHGGEIITFGSDAHRPEHLGFKFKEAYELAKTAGFKYYAYYRNGKPMFDVIPQR